MFSLGGFEDWVDANGGTALPGGGGRVASQKSLGVPAGGGGEVGGGALAAGAWGGKEAEVVRIQL